MVKGRKGNELNSRGPRNVGVKTRALEDPIPSSELLYSGSPDTMIFIYSNRTIFAIHNDTSFRRFLSASLGRPTRTYVAAPTSGPPVSNIGVVVDMEPAVQ
ncbi:hypothetical protein ACHWQZ_G006798 [Mnemiopsis leidyi]